MTYYDLDFDQLRDEINLSNGMKIKVRYVYNDNGKFEKDDMFDATHREITLFDRYGEILNKTIEKNPYKTNQPIRVDCDHAIEHDVEGRWI